MNTSRSLPATRPNFTAPPAAAPSEAATPAASPAVPADCRDCGRCCGSPSARYVPVRGADWERLGVTAESWAQFLGHRAWMRMQEGRCVALQVTGLGGAVRFTCAIYDRRPQACRDLERGSPACAAEIVRKEAGGRLSPPAPP